MTINKVNEDVRCIHDILGKSGISYETRRTDRGNGDYGPYSVTATYGAGKTITPISSDPFRYYITAMYMKKMGVAPIQAHVKRAITGYKSLLIYNHDEDHSGE